MTPAYVNTQSLIYDLEPVLKAFLKQLMCNISEIAGSITAEVYQFFSIFSNSNACNKLFYLYFNGIYNFITFGQTVNN